MTWSTEVIALVATTLATVLSGIGFFTKWALSQSDKRVEAAEKDKAEANARAKEERDVQNKRIDALIDSSNGQSRAISELTAALKVLSDGNREDMRKVNDGIATLLATREGRRT